MAFVIPKQPYSGKINESILGAGNAAVKLGGEDAYQFHSFEGSIPNPPKIAMEIWDYDPSGEWPAAAVEPFKDVISSPDAWAKKCVKEYGADLIVLQLKSTDPNGQDRGADEAAKVAKKVIDAVDVPVVVWGTANNQKDEEVLKKIAEVSEGKNVALSPVEEGNHKGVGAVALGYGHTIVASSPIDVNLAKQLNILLGNLGVKGDKIVIDPTTGGLGYGLEYSYSVMERIRMAALTQEDDKLQNPMISNIGNEIWKCKEAGQDIDDAPTLGDPESRGILMESVAAVCYLMAGSDVIILRHPESVRIVRSFIDRIMNGGMATDVQGIQKRLESKQVDLAAISPEPDLTIGEGQAKPAAKVKEAAPAKEKAPAPAPKTEEKVVELKPKKKEEVKAQAKAPKETEAEAAEKAREDAKKKVEAEEARKKAEEEAAKKAEAEAAKKAQEDAKKKAEAEEARKKAEAEAKAKAKSEAKAKEEEELQALRFKRAQQREKMEAGRAAEAVESVPKTAAKEQLDLVERLSMNLDRIHRRT